MTHKEGTSLERQDTAISFLAVHGLACHWGCAGVHSRANQNGELEPQDFAKKT
jgi:hypothetical protein